MLRALVETVAWTVFFILLFVAVFMLSGKGESTVGGLAFGGFGVAALWVLVMGQLHAGRRGSVIACALVSALLLLPQLGILALAWLMSVGAQRDAMGIALLATAILVPLAIAGFVRRKLRRIRAGEAAGGGKA